MLLFDDLTEWQTASPIAREQAARTLAQELPKGFAFDGLHSFKFADRQCEIAQFTLGTARFSLIPGGVIKLGFDAASWTPTSAMLESWEGTAQAYGIEETLHHYVDARTSPIRTVKLTALLVETQYAEVGWRHINAASDKVQALLQKYPHGITEFSGTATRVTLQDGVVIAQQADENGLSHASVAKGFAKAGFRLPTPDEWEYLCGAGATTLFRWGDHVPCTRYPTDVRRQDETEVGNWECHRDANVFGLQIAFDPYRMELTSEAGLTYGGDGGCAICGGAGFLSGWLPLASAWNDPDFCRHPPEDEISLGYTVARRVLPLV